MSFTRQPILKPEVEKQLWQDLLPLWKDKALSASDIARELDFGEEGSVYEKLQPYHVYFFRRKAVLLSRRKDYIWLKEMIGEGFEPRKYKPEGVSRYKVQPMKLKPLTIDNFTKMLNEKLPNLSVITRRERSYIILHYWTPLRKSELYERSYEDFTTEEDYLTIHLLRKKKEHKTSVTDEPILIPFGLPLMNEVIDWLKDKEWYNLERNPKNRPWNIHSSTALTWVKEVFPDYYPHFFRFQWITKACDDEHTTITELKSKTGLNAITIDKYIMQSKRYQKTFDKRLMEKYGVQSLEKEVDLPKLSPKIEPKKEKPKNMEKKELPRKKEFENRLQQFAVGGEEE